MIQDDELILDRQTCRDEVLDGESGCVVRHVTASIVLTAHDHNAWMGATGLYHKIVVTLKLVVISRYEYAVVLCRVRQVRGVIPAGQSGQFWRFHLMPGLN